MVLIRNKFAVQREKYVCQWVRKSPVFRMRNLAI